MTSAEMYSINGGVSVLVDGPNGTQRVALRDIITDATTIKKFAERIDALEREVKMLRKEKRHEPEII